MKIKSILFPKSMALRWAFGIFIAIALDFLCVYIVEHTAPRSIWAVIEGFFGGSIATGLYLWYVDPGYMKRHRYYNREEVRMHMYALLSATSLMMYEKELKGEAISESDVTSYMYSYMKDRFPILW